MMARRNTTRKTATRRRGGRSTGAKRPAEQPSHAPSTGPAPQLLRPRNANELVVRMYRQGLGDCFLLALPAKNDAVKYVLIDCGVHMRQTNGPARLAQVMDHLVASTGSHIHVVVATHEH